MFARLWRNLELRKVTTVCNISQFHLIQSLHHQLCLGVIFCSTSLVQHLFRVQCRIELALVAATQGEIFKAWEGSTQLFSIAHGSRDSGGGHEVADSRRSLAMATDCFRRAVAPLAPNFMNHFDARARARAGRMVMSCGCRDVLSPLCAGNLVGRCLEIGHSHLHERSKCLCSAAESTLQK